MFNTKLTKNCECCGASYVGGKEYGNYWCQLPIPDENGVIVFKGLCEFCNPNPENVWYTPKKPCHKDKVLINNLTLT